MVLLHWCILRPNSELAAIRFPPVRISSIRIFPTGAQPFDQCPEIVAQTEPESCYLEVLFNASTTNQSDSKEKRPPNELVPTSIAYTGGQMDFPVRIGAEYATRLMIVKGQFESLSLAIYGDVIADLPPAPENYVPRQLPSVLPVPLSHSVDPANAVDPTMLARQLLALTPDSPSLSLVIRLILCIKPYDDEWDMPEFPHLYTDLHVTDPRNFDLDKAVQLIARPISESASEESLTNFAQSVSATISDKADNQALNVATILAISASQHPSMALALCQHLDLSLVFDVITLTETVLLQLLDAAANADIARWLNVDTFLDTLHELQIRSNDDKATRLAAHRLVGRIRSWDIFDDALTNPQGDFTGASLMLRDIGSDEHAMGAWLETMLIHDDLSTKLSETSVLLTPALPPPLFHDPALTVSHDEFIAFVRAYIGVACVFTVLGWADSLPNDHCRERALAILRLWQGIEGYANIVNHFFLLPQFSKRLGWIIGGNDPPRKSGILGEQILAEIVKDPQAMLYPQIVQTLLSLKQPLGHIAESERLLMRKAALVMDDGLAAAVEEVAFHSDHPLSLRRLRTLRVSLAVIARDLKKEDGPWNLAKLGWEEHSIGILARLIDIFGGVSEDLNAYFVIDSPPSMNQTVVEQLFHSAADLLHIIFQLGNSLPMAAHSLRRFVVAVANSFVCAHMAADTFSPTNPICMLAQLLKQRCLAALCHFSGPDISAEPDRQGAGIVLKSLLGHALHNGRQDPAHHLVKIFLLIDHILPTSDTFSPDALSQWVTFVLPSVSNDFKTLLRFLDPENKVHIVMRLISLDEDVIGIAEWLFLEELKYLSRVLTSIDSDQSLVGYYQVNQSIQFMYTLAARCPQWFVKVLTSNRDIAQTLSSCLLSIVDGRYVSRHVIQLTEWLGSQSINNEDKELLFSVVLCWFHITQYDPKAISRTHIQLLNSLSGITLDAQRLQEQIGLTLAALSRQGDELDTNSVEPILSWLMAQDSTYRILRGITTYELGILYEKTQSDIFREKFAVDEDVLDISDIIELPDSLVLSVDEMKSLLSPETVEAPSTPKRNNLPDIMNVIISPPSAILRSPAATGLTKTYANNDFRELRQIPSARQNTSRLPSMHVDDYELNASPVLVPISDAFNPFQLQ